MRLRHRVVLGLAMAALAVAVPANRWLLVYAGLALVALTPLSPVRAASHAPEPRRRHEGSHSRRSTCRVRSHGPNVWHVSHRLAIPCRVEHRGTRHGWGGLAAPVSQRHHRYW